MTDAVVIGSGPNGLAAANLLADHGWSVTVLEATSTPGGAVRSGELVEPGFTTDICSAFYPLAAASPTIGDLRLEQHGLRWRHAPVALAHPTLDGTCAVISRDIDVTAASLDSFHPGDGDAWRHLIDRWHTLSPGLLGALFTPFPPVKAGLQLGAAVGPRDLVRFARFTLVPARRLGEEEFAGDGGRRLIAGNALHADFAPESTLSGFFGWLLSCMAQDGGYPVPEGGAGSFSGAMVKRLGSLGAVVRCDSPVTEIVVRDGRARAVVLADGTEVDARRAVVADVNAPMLYRHLVAAHHLPPRLLDDLERFQWDDATVKVDWTLNGSIPWTSEDARKAGTVHVGEGVDALTLHASELARGLVPATPFMLMGQQAVTDPTRQPAGTDTAWAYTHVPRTVRGDAGGSVKGSWDAADTEQFVERMEAQVEALAPGFRDRIRARHVLTPPAFERENPNLDGSAINGGTSQLHQQLVFRPVPGLGRAETPVRGLFLASGSAHPGGGVHGAAGSNAARAAIAGDRRRRLLATVRRSAKGPRG